MSQMIEIKLPSDQQEGTENIVGNWLKKVGDLVTLHEPLLEINTDKVTVEIPSPATGMLSEILIKEGASVGLSDVLGIIDTNKHHLAPSTQMATQTAEQSKEQLISNKPGSSSINSKDRLSPAVKSLLKQHNLSASDISGTGRDGRITPEDVKLFVSSEKKSTGDISSNLPKGNIPSRLIPHNAMRKSIATHMVSSLLHTAPHVTTVFELDLTNILADKAKRQSELESKGIKLTLTPYFISAIVAAVKVVPEVNSRFHENGVEIFDDINIGVATALPGASYEDVGLIVPVLSRCQDLDLNKIAANLQLLTTKAREDKLSPADVRNGTFTISNHGVSGSLFATPIIINQPQSAILGVGKIEKRPKVIECADGSEKIEVRKCCYVTLTLDHRVLDAIRANLFMSTLISYLEEKFTKN